MKAPPGGSAWMGGIPFQYPPEHSPPAGAEGAAGGAVGGVRTELPTPPCPRMGGSTISAALLGMETGTSAAGGVAGVSGTFVIVAGGREAGDWAAAVPPRAAAS